MMRKVLILFFIALFITSCGTKQEEPEQDEVIEDMTEEPKKEVTLAEGIVPYLLDHILYISIVIPGDSQAPTANESKLFKFEKLSEDSEIVKNVRASIPDFSKGKDVYSYQSFVINEFFNETEKYESVAFIEDKSDNKTVVLTFVEGLGEGTYMIDDYLAKVYTIEYEENKDWKVSRKSGEKGFATPYKPSENVKEFMKVEVTNEGNGVRIRTSPEVNDNNKTGETAKSGFMYYVLDIKTDDEFTWYKISMENWIASKDNWLKVIN